MKQCASGFHLWDYDHTTNPAPECPYPTFNYRCAFGCDFFQPVLGLYSTEECPHDVGYAIDPLVENDSPVVMCMRCLWSPDPDSELNQKQLKLYVERLLWCGPVCGEHGEVAWPK